MLEFKDRLKELMDKENLSPEKLESKLKKFIGKNGKNIPLTKSTIRNYINGNSQPKNVENIQILADFFNVSTDYIQGKTDVKTTDIKIKNISNEYGLTEKSLIALKRINQMKKDFKYTTIDTVNKLLEEIEDKKFNSIFQLIDDYLNINIKTNYEIAITEKSDVFVWDKSKNNRTSGKATINNEILIQSILLKIQAELINMRNYISKEGEKDDCKRTRKK